MARKTMRTYRVTYNGETQHHNTTREGIVQAGIGVFSDGAWFSSLSTLADPVKAARSARSCNRYAALYTVAPVEEIPYAGPNPWKLDSKRRSS